MNLSRIVITGVGLTAPNGNNLAEFRQALLTGKSGVELFETRHMGKVLAGVCKFEATRYQTRKELRIGTRAGSVSIYSSHEAVKDSGIAWDKVDKSRVGIYLGITEHGNVETENEIASLATFNNDTKFWSHYHNPRTVANNPAGEASLNLGVTGPAYTLGAACAAGNIGIIHAAQMLRLGEVDFALAGGVSESIRSFGIFAAFKSQGALAHHVDPTKASRPFDKARNGIVVSEGGCIFAMERLEDAVARGAKIYAEIAGYAINSDASDYVLPNPVRQAECIRLAIKNAGMTPEQIDILNTHATSTPLGDVQECQAVASAFEGHQLPHINNTKGFIGHAMGAAGSIELAGNLPSFDDLVVHPTINVDDLDPQCALSTLVLNQPKKVKRVDAILNNSFGMLGINSALIVKRYVA